MKSVVALPILVTLMMGFGVLNTDAADPDGPDKPSTKLIVATKEAPPFAIKRPDGSWEGLSIELWEFMATQLDLHYEYRDLTLPDLLKQVEAGDVDLAVSALTITPERESRMDFTYAYYYGGLGLAISANRESLLAGVFKRLVSWQFVSAVGALSAVLAVAAIFVWIFERRTNPDQFGGSHLQGLGASFWWSAVTMTTVGYGDKAPKTTGGRVVGLIWMFASIIIVSSFTAGIASSLTASQVASNQLRSKPLGSLIIATVEGSTGEDYARKSGLRCSTYPGLGEALEAIQKGEAEAIIYDLPLLKYRLMQQPDLRLEIMPKTLVQESYAIALPPGSARRETLNRALLSVIGSPEWQVLRTEYLGNE